MPTITGSPSGYGTTEWTNPQNAYADDANKASVAIAAKNTEKNGIWTTFGITDPGGTTTITKVEIGTQHYLSTISSIIAKMGREISWDGGTTWSPTDHEMPEAECEVTTETATIWVDVTSDTSWTWTKLNNTNLQVRISCKQGNDATGFTMYLDVIYVRVTYNTVTTYTISKNSDARFKATFTLSKNSNARFLKSGITIDKNSDARFSKSGLYIDKTSDAQFTSAGGTRTIDKHSDARFKKVGIFFSKTSDARFLAHQLLDKSVDARFRKTLILDKQSDARFQSTEHIDKSSDARFKATVGKQLTSNAYFGTWTEESAKTNAEWLKVY